MILLKRKNLLFFFSFFLRFLNIYTQPKDNNLNEVIPNNLNTREKNINNDNSQIKEKEICLIEENNKLKIKIEVYNIYFNFLIFINILFLIILISFIIYKICSILKKENSEEDTNNDEILLNYIEKSNNNDKELLNDKEKIYDKNQDEDNSFMNGELLNNSGLEAPPVLQI